MRIQIGISHGQAVHLKVDVCQVQIVNTVDEIFTLEYQEIDFQIKLILVTKARSDPDSLHYKSHQQLKL